jgi:sulfonate transport system substrate-binding protein
MRTSPHNAGFLCGLVLLGCVALLAVAFAGQAGGQQTPPPLRIAGNMTTIELAPVLVAADRLYRGPITVIDGGIPALVSGDVDAATNAETQALRQSVDNPGIRIIFTVAEGFYRIVARRSAGIRQVSDLRGKRITTPRNTSAHYYLAKTLGLAGVSEDDVTIVPVTPATGMSGALRNREVDAVAMWEPESENAITAVGDDAVVLQDRKVYRELFNLQTTDEVLADPAKRAALVELLRSLIAASGRIRSNPKEVWPLLSSKLHFSEPLIEKSWPHLRYAGSMVSDLLNVMEEEEPWIAKERNRTPRSRAQLATLIDGSLLAEARKPAARR